MGAVPKIVQRGRVRLVGDGTNRFNPIHCRDLAALRVDAAPGDTVGAGGPDMLTRREVAELAGEVVMKQPKTTRLPERLTRGLVQGIGPLNTQSGDLADLVATAGDIHTVAPTVGSTTQHSYLEELNAPTSQEPTSQKVHSRSTE